MQRKQRSEQRYAPNPALPYCSTESWTGGWGVALVGIGIGIPPPTITDCFVYVIGAKYWERAIHVAGRCEQVSSAGASDVPPTVVVRSCIGRSNGAPRRS